MKPHSPNRLKLSAIGLVVGLLLGAVVSAGAEMTDDRLYTEKELKNLMPADVIAEIPGITTLREERDQRRMAVLDWAATGLAFTLILAGFAISYLRG